MSDEFIPRWRRTVYLVSKDHLKLSVISSYFEKYGDIAEIRASIYETIKKQVFWFITFVRDDFHRQLFKDRAGRNGNGKKEEEDDTKAFLHKIQKSEVLVYEYDRNLSSCTNGIHVCRSCGVKSQNVLSRHCGYVYGGWFTRGRRGRGRGRGGRRKNWKGKKFKSKSKEKKSSQKGKVKNTQTNESKKPKSKSKERQRVKSKSKSRQSLEKDSNQKKPIAIKIKVSPRRIRENKKGNVKKKNVVKVK